MIEPRITGRIIAALGGLALLTAGGAARADNSQRSWNFLTTGNGHGFQVFDTNKNQIVTFLDHPYRYLGPPTGDPKQDGPSRRNLAYSFYFGVRGAGTSGWLNAPSSAADPEYLDDANIIHAAATLGVNVDSYFFAPFGYEGNAFVGLVKAPGATDAFALFNFHMGNVGSDPDAPDSNGESSRPVAGLNAIVETGPGGGAMVYVALNGLDHSDCNGAYAKVQGGQDLASGTTCSQNDVVPAFEKALASDGWMGVAAQYVDDPATADATAQALVTWAANRPPAQILSDARAEFEGWRKAPANDVALCSDTEKHLWRQSEAVLRMGQIREPNIPGRQNNGMMLASLPPGQWHSGWVRDGTYAIVALSRMGHYAEAKAALDFLLNATADRFKSYVSNQDYRISVCRYYGNGEEEADYSGQPTPNVEIDGWGLVMWAARQYVDNSGDVAWLNSMTTSGMSVYNAITSGIAAPLEANLEPNGIVKADSSIWEVHDGNKRHFAYTSLAAARGFCDMAVLAQKNGASPTHYQNLSSTIRSAIFTTFADPNGAIGGSLEGLTPPGTYYDGSVAEAFTWNILPDFTGSTATATLTMLNNLRVASGGFERNNNGQSSYDDNEWILVDMRISNALRRAGRGAEADSYFGQNVAKAAANFNLLPELYNAVPADGAIGIYTGSIPMVGYGGGTYVMTVLDRAGKIEPNDCADGKGVTLPALTCGGIMVGGSSSGAGSGGGSNGGSGGGGSGSSGGENAGVPDASQVPYRPACLCDLSRPQSSPAALALLCLPLALVGRRIRRKPR